MCKYCVESQVISYLEAVASGEIVDVNGDSALPQAILLLEVDTVHLPALAQLPDPSPFITVLHCRCYEQLLAFGSSDLYHQLAPRLAPSALTAYRAELRANTELGHHLADLDLNDVAGYPFIGGHLLTETRHILVIYADALSGDKATDQASSLPFALVWFAFLYVTRHEPQADILRRIALQTPQDRDFLSLKLFLQRRAYAFCVQEYGVEFIVHHHQGLRLELVYYTLLTLSIHPLGLSIIADYFTDHPIADFHMNFNSHDLLMFIKTFRSAPVDGR